MQKIYKKQLRKYHGKEISKISEEEKNELKNVTGIFVVSQLTKGFNKVFNKDHKFKSWR